MDRVELAALLREHGFNQRKSYYPEAVCACGVRTGWAEHYLHVADEIIHAAEKDE